MPTYGPAQRAKQQFLDYLMANPYYTGALGAPPPSWTTDTLGRKARTAAFPDPAGVPAGPSGYQPIPAFTPDAGVSPAYMKDWIDTVRGSIPGVREPGGKMYVEPDRRAAPTSGGPAPAQPGADQTYTDWKYRVGQQGAYSPQPALGGIGGGYAREPMPSQQPRTGGLQLTPDQINSPTYVHPIGRPVSGPGTQAILDAYSRYSSVLGGKTQQAGAWGGVKASVRPEPVRRPFSPQRGLRGVREPGAPSPGSGVRPPRMA